MYVSMFPSLAVVALVPVLAQLLSCRLGFSRGEGSGPADESQLIKAILIIKMGIKRQMHLKS